MLYEDMTNTEGQIVDEIFKLLIDKQEINKRTITWNFCKM